MKETGYISPGQMFSVLFLSRIISLFTFMLPSASFLPSGDRVITALPVFLIELVYASVLIFTLRKNRNRSIVEKAKDITPSLARGISIIYCLALIWFAGIGIARFELFISTVMFPNSELTLMIVILIAASVYASLKGTEAIGRASVILMSILFLSIAFILISVTKEFEYSNLKPLFTEGISPVLGFSFYVSLRAPEILSLHISAGYVRGNVKKMIFLWILSFSILCTVILTFLTGVTGEYGNDQIFPLYTLTVIAKFGIFERLDDILTGIWVLCSFIRTAYLLNTGLLSIRQGFGKAGKAWISLACAAGVFAVYILTSGTVAVFSETVSSVWFDILSLCLILILPVIISLADKKRQKRRSSI